MLLQDLCTSNGLKPRLAPAGAIQTRHVRTHARITNLGIGWQRDKKACRLAPTLHIFARATKTPRICRYTSLISLKQMLMIISHEREVLRSAMGSRAQSTVLSHRLVHFEVFVPLTDASDEMSRLISKFVKRIPLIVRGHVLSKEFGLSIFRNFPFPSFRYASAYTLRGFRSSDSIRPAKSLPS